MGTRAGELMSKNACTVEQLKLMCQHYDKIVAAGVTANLAIRSLEAAVDATAKHRVIGNAGPHSVRQVPSNQWSRAAKAAHSLNPDRSAKEYLRVEHGTPRRAFTKLILEAHRAGNLNDQTFEGLITKHWKIAVITLDEDTRLPRSEMRESPDKRWADAGIHF